MKRAWTSADILPSGGSLTLLGIATTTDGVIVEADGPGSARCPSCRHHSVARHSRYWRTIKDLPAHGQAVTLRVRVGRWRCHNARCAQAIFADRLGGVVAPRVQHTDRLGAIVHLVGHALGGRAGERLLARLGMTIGADTIVCLVKRGAPAATPDATLRVLGIDDWAWQKGQQHFGTILVDLERRRVVDVLAVRTADAVAAWLAAHPGIQIISRDRHGPYADAVRRGAPQARQVADRFHLVLNLRGAVQQELGRQRRFLVVPQNTPTVPASGRPPARSPMVRRQRSKVLEHDARVAEERRATQLARFRLVKRLQAAGRSAQAIMRETGIGRRFVTNWIRLNDLPERNRMDPRVGMAEFYREYLLRRWTEGCQIGRVLMGEIQTLGYVGSYAGLAKLLAPGDTTDRPSVVAVLAAHRSRVCSPDTCRRKLRPRCSVNRARCSAHARCTRWMR
jgi:transposase